MAKAPNERVSRGVLHIGTISKYGPMCGLILHLYQNTAMMLPWYCAKTIPLSHMRTMRCK